MRCLETVEISQLGNVGICPRCISETGVGPIMHQCCDRTLEEMASEISRLRRQISLDTVRRQLKTENIDWDWIDDQDD